MANNKTYRPKPGYADPGLVAEAAHDMPTEYLVCRNGNHNYKPRSVNWIPKLRIFRVVQVCGGCKAARRTWELDVNGFILDARTTYLPPGRNKPSYVIRGLGRPDQAGRAAIRLELIQRWNPVTLDLDEES